MDGAIIFYLVLATLLVVFAIAGMISVARSTKNADIPIQEGSGKISAFKQKLIDINKVPHPKGKGTLWLPE